MPLRVCCAVAVRVGAASLALALVGCGGGSGGGGTSVAEFCSHVDALNDKLDFRAESNLAPLGKSELTSLAAEARKLADEAPAEVKADVKTFVVFLEEASSRGLGGVDAATEEAVSNASDRIVAFQDDKCP